MPSQPSVLLPRKPCRPSSSAPRVLIAAMSEDQPDEVIKRSTRVSVESLRNVLRCTTASSKVVSLSMAYAEMLQQTSELPYPNTLRTAFASAVLDYILQSSPSVAIWKPLVDDVRKDIFASVYSQDNPSVFVDGDTVDPSGNRFSSFPTYFSIAKKTTSALEDLRRDVVYRSTVGRKEMMITERIIKRWQLMLLDRLFCAWRQFTKQNRKKEFCLERCLGKKKDRSLLKKVFCAWSRCTLKERCARVQTDFSLLQTHKMQGEDKLVVDFTKMSEAIESIKLEKTQIQDQYRRLQDDLVDARATVDKLQQRLDQQKNIVSSWRECALQLTAAIRFPPRTMELLIPAPQPSMTMGTAVESPGSPLQSPVSRSFAVTVPTVSGFTGDSEADVLHWINLVRQASHASSTAEQSSNNDDATTRDVSNFGSDLANGEALLDVVQFLQLGRVSSSPLSPSAPQTIALCVSLLQEFSSCSSLAISVDDVINSTKPEVMQLLMSLVMRRASACPICSSDGISSLSSARIESFADFRTPYEVNIMFTKCVENYRRISTAQAQSSGCAVAAAVTAASRSGSARAFVDRQLVAELFSQNQGAVTKEDIDGICEEVVKNGVELSHMFRCYAPLTYGGTVSLPRFHKFLSDSKLLDKSFGEKDANQLFDFLSERESSRRKPIVSPQRGTRSSVPGLDIASWIALLIQLSVPKAHETSSLGSIVRRFVSLVEKCRKNCSGNGIDEFQELFGSPQVQDVVLKSATQLARMFDENCESPPGMTLLEFTALLKDAKVLEYPVTTDEVRRLVEFVTDVPADAARLNLDYFTQCVVAIGFVKHSMVWVPAADRLKLFFKKDLFSSTPNRGSGARKLGKA